MNKNTVSLAHKVAERTPANSPAHEKALEIIEKAVKEDYAREDAEQAKIDEIFGPYGK